jgi:hypothetical protein
MSDAGPGVPFEMKRTGGNVPTDTVSVSAPASAPIFQLTFAVPVASVFVVTLVVNVVPVLTVPLDGDAVNVTPTPDAGFPLASFTTTVGAIGRIDPTTAVCRLPAVATIDAGALASAVTLTVTEVIPFPLA